MTLFKCNFLQLQLDLLPVYDWFGGYCGTILFVVRKFWSSFIRILPQILELEQINTKFTMHSILMSWNYIQSSHYFEQAVESHCCIRTYLLRYHHPQKTLVQTLSPGPSYCFIMKKNKYIGENDMLYDNCRNVKFTGSEMPVFVCAINIVNTIDFWAANGLFVLIVVHCQEDLVFLAWKSGINSLFWKVSSRFSLTFMKGELCSRKGIKVKLNRRWCYDWYRDTLRHACILDIQVFNSFTMLNFSFPLIICANMIK